SDHGRRRGAGGAGAKRDEQTDDRIPESAMRDRRSKLHTRHSRTRRSDWEDVSGPTYSAPLISSAPRSVRTGGCPPSRRHSPIQSAGSDGAGFPTDASIVALELPREHHPIDARRMPPTSPRVVTVTHACTSDASAA